MQENNLRIWLCFGFAQHPVHWVLSEAEAQLTKNRPMKKAINDWKFVVLACLTLGLAPFTPQPHIISKLIWLKDGAKGQDWLDWVDLGMHTLPWLLLLRWVVLYFFRQFKKEQPPDM